VIYYRLLLYEGRPCILKYESVPWKDNITIRQMVDQRNSILLLFGILEEVNK